MTSRQAAIPGGDLVSRLADADPEVRRIYVMTARPGRIKAHIEVPLPRPRTPEMTYTPDFVALVQRLKALIREESLAAMGSELKDGGLAGFGMTVGPQGVKEVV